MRAIEAFLDGLIDYAGLYPPAGLDMHSAVEKYQSGQRGKQGRALGRFVVDLNRIEEFRSVAGASADEMRLSLIVSRAADGARVAALLDAGLHIEAVEFKAGRVEEVATYRKHVPSGVTTYIEVPVDGDAFEFIDAIAGSGNRIKLRMGGLVAAAFPEANLVAKVLNEALRRRLLLKATAGLHHPIRSRHPFTYENGSSSGMMHGFVNLFCAAALVYFGGTARDAERILNEEKANAWEVCDDAIAWGAMRWSTAQIREVRQDFMIGIGSCSFEEPMRDLEALGWL